MLVVGLPLHRRSGAWLAQTCRAISAPQQARSGRHHPLKLLAVLTVLHMLALTSHACLHLATAAAAARRAALALPVIIVMPDDTAAFGAKLYRTPSGDMRWVLQWTGKSGG